MAAVLVTGAFGLVGNAVRTQLEAAGRRVVPIDIVARTEDGLPIRRIDVRDVHALHALAIAEGPFDAIIHCGALSGPMLARDNPAHVIDVNLGGTSALLELARIHKIPRFVFCSSVSAYGHTPPGLSLVPEDVPLQPTTVYGATKAAGEALVHGYANQHGVDGICLRIGWVYGPRRTTDCDIREMILAGLEGRPFRLPTGSAAMRQYVHVDDIARALILAAEAETTPRRAYSATGGTFVALPDVAAIVARHVPGFEAEIGPGIDPGEDVQGAFDLTAIETDLGYRPQTELETGIAAYVGWLAARLPA